jgi:hypothetical protein
MDSPDHPSPKREMKTKRPMVDGEKLRAARAEEKTRDAQLEQGRKGMRKWKQGNKKDM